jgi:hypothetical protein
MARLGRMCPADIGLRYSDLNFAIKEPSTNKQVHIAGWWIPAATRSDKTVLIIHGYGDSRAGALAWSPVWIEVGFNVVLIDLRAHGESGGTITTAGVIEQFDVRRIINNLRIDKPLETRQLLIFGISMGATIALSAANESESLAGVVIESPVADFTHGAATQSALLGLPGSIVVRPGIVLAEWWLGARFSSLQPVKLIEALSVPVLAMLPSNDPFLPPAHAEQIRRAVGARAIKDQSSQVFDFHGTTHLLAAHDHPEQYRDALQQFVNKCTDFGLARASAEGAGARQSN